MPDVANAVGTPDTGDNSQADPGETGTYACNANYAPSGDSEITCNNNNNVGEWETPTFTCTGMNSFTLICSPFIPIK